MKQPYVLSNNFATVLLIKWTISDSCKIINSICIFDMGYLDEMQYLMATLKFVLNFKSKSVMHDCSLNQTSFRPTFVSRIDRCSDLQVKLTRFPTLGLYLKFNLYNIGVYLKQGLWSYYC
jgi:hypothetical protein